MSRREHYELQYGACAGPKQLKEDEFPSFRDGDVEIILTGARVYRLHGGVLKNASPTLKAILSDEFTAPLSLKAFRKQALRSRLVAINNDDPSLHGTDVSIVLKPLGVDSDGKVENAPRMGLDNENGRIIDQIYIAYHHVFEAFYNRPIELGHFENTSLTDMLGTALEVTKVAEYLGVVHIITKPFEAALMATGQTLHRSIANDPQAWLDFSYRIRSRPIFREALIHAAGQFNTSAMQIAMKTAMKQPILDIVEKKGKVLMEWVKMAQLKMLSYYPQHMQRELTIGIADKDHIGRASYGNDIMSWIALTAFRHHASQLLASDETHHGSDMGYACIFAVNKGGDHYLDKSQLEVFHRFFPMTLKGKNVVESKLSEVKEYVKRFVTPLLKNESQLDIRQFPSGYFTCTRVEFHDYPWGNEAKPVEMDEDDAESETAFTEG